MGWVTIHDFASDRAQIEAMQKATLGPTDFGVSAKPAKPALVGTPEWWRAIDQGALPQIEIEGTHLQGLLGQHGRLAPRRSSTPPR